MRALARKPFLPHNFLVMTTLLKPISLVDVTNVLKITEIALIVLLIFVLAVLVLAFLRGLLRGWKYGTYRLVFFAIMVTVVLMTLGAQAKALGGMDLTRFNLPALNMTLTVDGTEHAISVTWTTLQSSLEDLIVQMAEAFGAKASYSGLLSYATVMATSLIKLLLIFAWGIVLSTLGLLLILLLWHLIFKRFTPKERRKIKKLRIVSAFEDLLIGAACVGMLLTPFTSIVNAMNGNFKVSEAEAKQNETVSMITDVLGVYNQSAFAKTFFSWNSMDGSTTFDQQLISFLTQSEAGKLKSDLVSEVGTLASVSSKVINAGLLNAKGSEGIRWYFLLSSSSIPELIYELSNTTLIQVALPFAVSLATNLDAVKDVLGEETCSYLSSTDLDWKEVLESMSRIYQNILDAGVIDCVVDVEEGSSTPSFDWTQLKYVFSGKDSSGNERDARKAMHDLAGEIKDSKLFSHLMAGLLSTLGEKEMKKEDRGDISLVDFLPLLENGDIDYKALVDMDYAREFNLIYDTVYSINEAAPILVDDVLDFVQNPPAEEEQGEKYRDMLAEASRHAKEFVELIVGERDSSGEPKDDSKLCLLDSAFIGNGLPSLVTFMEKSGGKVLDMELSFAGTKKKLVELKDYKREFGAALDVAADFASSDEGYAFLKEGKGLVYDPDGNLISIEPSLIKAVQGSMDKADDSLLMKEALPQVAEHYFETSLKGSLAEYGIEKVDFRCANLGHELSNLLDLVVYSGDLVLALSRIGDASSYLATSLIIEESDSLLRILDIFASSAILNPVIDGESNVNFASLLNRVFSSAGLEDFEIDSDTFSGLVLASEYDENGKLIKGHENAAILKVIVDLAKSLPLSEILSLGSASSAEMMKTLSKVDVRGMFENIANSEVMKKAAGSAMDKYIGSVLDLGEGSDISFKNVTDWKREGEIIGKIVDLATKGIDISNFDIDSISPETVKTLFSSLSQSEIFMKTDEEGNKAYKFPEFFSSKILGMLDDETLAYFKDKGASLPASPTLEEKKAGCSTFVANCAELSDPADWDGEEGEIAIFAKILGEAQSLGGFSSISSFSHDSLPTLRALLDDLSSSSCLGQVLIANALGKSLSSLSSSSLDLSLASPDVFFEDEYKDAAKRKAEASKLCDAMDIIFDPYYGFLDSEGNFDESKMSLSSLSVDYCLKPLLEIVSDSAILNTPKESSGETLLKSLFKSILVKSGLYGEGLSKDSEISSSHYPGVSISSIVDGVSDMDGEITVFCDALKLVQDSGLLGSDGSLALSSVDSSSLEKVTSLLKKINSSEMLYRALPLQLEKSISSLSLPDPFQGDLASCDPFVMKGAAYPEEEIDCLASLLSVANEFSSLDSASLSQLAKLDPSKILSPLYASRVFNSASETSPDELTSAQSFLSHLLAQMKLGDLIYSSSSPKDVSLSLSSAEEKYDYLVSSTLGKGQAGDYSKYALSSQSEKGNAFYETIGQGEGGLASFLNNLRADSLAPMLEGGDIDFASLSGATLSSLLKDLCKCKLLSDVPVNALAKYLSGSELSINGIDLSLTNFYYPYYYSPSGSKLAIPDFSSTYDSNEIDLLVDLLDLMDLTKDGFSSGNVEDLDPYLLRQTLLELSDSLLFHRTGANSSSPNYGLGWSSGDYLPGAAGASVKSDLTVFEQMMYYVYDTSGLAERAFDEFHDFAYWKKAGFDKKLGAELKVHEKIKGLSSWAKEIEALTTDDAGSEGLIKVAQDSGLLTSGGKSVDMSSDVLKTLDPNEAMKLMRTLGRSEVCADALSTTISSLLTTGEEGSSSSGLGVGNFSTYSSSVGISSSFSSEEAFLKRGFAYEKVIFTSASYSSTDEATLKCDLDGDGVYEYDLSKYASYDSASSSWIFSTSKIGCAFKITLPSDGSITYSFDSADYYLPYGSLEEGGANAKPLSDFLTSVYKESDGTYYSFKADSSSLLEASENIHLYGIASMIIDSTFYSSSCFDSSFLPCEALGEGGFSARSLSLYQLFSVSPNSSLSIKILDAIDAPKLEETYGGSAIPLSARLSSIEGRLDGASAYAEGAFLEKSLAGISLSEGVHATLAASFSSTLDDASKTYAYRSSIQTLLEGTHYDDFLSSSEVAYAYPEEGEGKSVFADELIASSLNKRVSERLSYAKLSTHALGAVSLDSPTEPSRLRIAFLSDDDCLALSSFDAYGYDPSSKTYSRDGLASLIDGERKALAFQKLASKGVSVSSPSIPTSQGDFRNAYLLTAEEKASFSSLCAKLDALSGKVKSYINLAYVSDVYDFFVYKGTLAKNLFLDYFFHAEFSPIVPTPGTMVSTTDFPSTYGNCVLNGLETVPFSYENLAKVSMSE